uniref:UDENN domain-containing protein n=1 Tax=Toxocara canis TaxID=6265 RepID=A0A183TZW3_TOXCA
LGILKCPRCPDRLEALDLEHFMEEGVQYQRILWMEFLQTCSFPIDMPHNVFWTKRTVEQEQAGFIPLPQIHLLPRRYHHLYPMFFATKGSHALCLIGQDKKVCHVFAIFSLTDAFWSLSVFHLSTLVMRIILPVRIFCICNSFLSERQERAGSGNSSDRRKRIRSQSTDTLTAFDEDCSVSQFFDCYYTSFFCCLYANFCLQFFRMIDQCSMGYCILKQFILSALNTTAEKTYPHALRSFQIFSTRIEV